MNLSFTRSFHSDFWDWSFQYQQICFLCDCLLFAGGKTQELVLIEYLVRWSGYDSKYDTWVRKDSISPVAVREYESGKQDFGEDTPGQILAKVPAGLHPSHVAYKSAQEMALWSSAHVHLCVFDDFRHVHFHLFEDNELL